MTPPRPAAGLLALVVATTSTPVLALPEASVDGVVRRFTAELQQVWRREPATAGRPFPSVRVVPSLAAQACGGAPFPASQPLLLACPSQGAILLERARVAPVYAVFGEGGVAFLVAYGLGQSLLSSLAVASPPGGIPPPATPGLQAACAAGTLLAALPIATAARRLQLNNAITAAEQVFESGVAPQLGSGPMRAFAVYSGMGGSSLDCSAAAMGRLAGGGVNIDSFLATRGISVPIDAFCRQPPACPRRLTLGAAGGE